MTSNNLRMIEHPVLERTVMLIAFEGWPDAGKVATGAVNYMKDKLRPKKFAEVRADDFYVYHTLGSDHRNAYATIRDGITEDIKLPTTGFWSYKNRTGGSDLIIVIGHEPELRWQEYVGLILDVAQKLNVSRIIALGGTFDQIPHTVEPVISAVVNDPAQKTEFTKLGMGLVNYEGQCAIHSLLLSAAAERKLPAASLWGHTPHYIQVANTRGCYALLDKLTGMLNIPLDLEDIRRAGEFLYAQVSLAINQKAELRDSLKQMEQNYLQGKLGMNASSGRDVIKEVEDYLKEREDKS